MEIYTIGFTKRTAKDFFETLKASGVRRLLDVRLNNVSQLAGFSKRDDLRYFLESICNIGYKHELLLAPDEAMLKDYKRDGILSWSDYEQKYRSLLILRDVKSKIAQRDFDEPTVLLCSEFSPAKCHRRLAAEFLSDFWSDVTIKHL